MTVDAVKTCDPAALPALAQRVREKILDTVSRTGGHLASSLGTVELTIGLLRVFDPPHDRVVWDVGHQAYAWKILTDRADSFQTLRQVGGLSGFPNPAESPYDAFVAGHAGAALSAATGMAAARDRLGGGHVVAVVGDAALTNGESLEALNTCASLTDKVIIVVNDNAMSISRNVGAMARMLGRLLADVRYNRAKAVAERAGHRMRLTFLRKIYHHLEQLIKSVWLGNGFFENFGLRYIGPVDGHDLKAVESALTVAKEDKRSVVVHVVTVKGKGFAPAERNPTAWHGVGPFDRAACLKGACGTAAAKKDWSAVFGAALSEAARRDPRVCALTAAMRDGTGLAPFAHAFPDRFFDVGICESHLVTFAAGLAKSGFKPVVAVYSTFLQRAIDQVMHDVCLLKLPVIFGIDRAGVVGADGWTHQGVFDIPMLRCLPNLAILQPTGEAELEAMLSAAFAHGGPVAIRYPRGVPAERPAGTPVEWGRAEQLTRPEAPIQIWALGDQVPKALRVAELLSEKDVAAGVVNARFVKPFDAALLTRQRAAGARIVSLENGACAGGFGEAIGADLRFGWPDRYLDHGTPDELERAHGLTAPAVAEAILTELTVQTRKGC